MSVKLQTHMCMKTTKLFTLVSFSLPIFLSVSLHHLPMWLSLSFGTKEGQFIQVCEGLAGHQAVVGL